MIDVGERTFDFSLAVTRSRNEGRQLMRWRADGEEWHCTEIISALPDYENVKWANAYVEQPLEGNTNHLKITCKLMLDGDIAYISPPTIWPEDEPYTVAKTLPETHVRMCANNAGSIEEGNQMRCRDERTGELEMVRGFRGPAHLNWIDHGTHVFDDSAVDIDTNGWARLKAPIYDPVPA